MSSESKNKGVLQISKFPHGFSTPRAEKWRSWWSRVKAAFGASFPLFANQLDHTCDPHEDFWGLPWHPCHDFYNMGPMELTKMNCLMLGRAGSRDATPSQPQGPSAHGA